MLSMIAPLLLAAAAAPPAAEPLPPIPLTDGGFCVGLGWITLRPGDATGHQAAPDFSVYRVKRTDGSYFGIYAGDSPRADPDPQPLLTRDGVSIYPAREDGTFHGYLAKGPGALTDHFFGSVFAGSSDDAAFFDAIDFGPAGQAKCKDHPAP